MKNFSYLCIVNWETNSVYDANFFIKMIKVEFTSTFDSPKNFYIICKKLGITYEKDPNYKQHFFGCDAPDVGYIVDTDNFQEIKKLATKDLYVENLIEY